jgi:hypothetical protein
VRRGEGQDEEKNKISRQEELSKPERYLARYVKHKTSNCHKQSDDKKG